MQRRLRTMWTVTCVLVLIAGICIMAYPHVRGAMMDWQASQTAEEFLSRVVLAPYREKEADNIIAAVERATEPVREYAELWDDMTAYNDTIYCEQQSSLCSVDSYKRFDFTLVDYGLEDEIFGVITIPAIDVNMPIYLGANSENMAVGTAVMSQTSLPIGGDNTNAVICGHRGWKGAAYFLHIDELKVGDEVTITNLWAELHYEVVGTKIISPHDVDAIKIQEGKDMITLLSCHPVASGGKQRYLVFCERVA